jgi:HSP20 family protein
MNRHNFFPAIPFLSGGFSENAFTKSDKLHIPVNIAEEADRLEIELALPGFSKEQLDLNLDDNNLLKIEGKVPDNEQSSQSIRRRNEFSVKPFSKSFRLGKGLERKGIQASFLNGILRISIPKISRETKNESIAIPLV